MAKRGRKRQHYTTTWGDTIVGLGQLPDGRWVELEDRQHPWSSANERDAIRELRRRQAARRKDDISVVLRQLPLAQLDEEIEDALKPELEVIIDADGITVETPIPAQPYFDLFARLLRENPKLVAERTATKELAYLEQLQPPPAPLTLLDIRKLYSQKPFEDPNESKRSLKFWDEFCRAVAPAKAANEVKPEHLMKYHRECSSRPHASKTIRNRYMKIGSILKYAHNLKPEHRAVIQNLRTELHLICRTRNENAGQPDPIEVDDFAALYQAADIRWRAILLCMLNFAMHPKEAGELLKEEVNTRTRELRSRRTRTKVWRVASVWPETIQAIQEYAASQANNPAYVGSRFLFLNTVDRPFGRSALTYYYRETLKPRAEKLAKRTLHCTLDSIRDGGQNAADSGGADSIHTEMLMGHALPGAMGNYKVRAPAKTIQSVECIREHYQIGELVASCKAQTNGAS